MGVFMSLMLCKTDQSFEYAVDVFRDVNLKYYLDVLFSIVCSCDLKRGCYAFCRYLIIPDRSSSLFYILLVRNAITA